MIYAYKNSTPCIHASVFLAPGCRIIGNVEIGKDSSIWFNVVLRGDLQKITIGEGSNIQDNAVVHVGEFEPCTVGNEVTVGHGVNLHGCMVHDHALIGIGAVVLTGAVIGKGAIVAAGSVVIEGTQVPENCLVTGIPARVKRHLKKEGRHIKTWAHEYIELSREFRQELRLLRDR